VRETTFHSLRASFITQLLLRGTPLNVVQKLADHADVKTTMLYCRMVASELQGFTNVIGLDLDEMPEGKVLQFVKDDC